jgi:hypothetical protein
MRTPLKGVSSGVGKSFEIGSKKRVRLTETQVDVELKEKASLKNC